VTAEFVVNNKVYSTTKKGNRVYGENEESTEGKESNIEESTRRDEAASR